MTNLKFNDYKQSKYKYTSLFYDGLALVMDKNNLYGFIDKKGKEVIPCQYVDARYFSEGLVAVKKSDTLRWGFINAKGEEVIPFKFLDAGWFNEGLAEVKLEHEYGMGSYWTYIDMNGEKITDVELSFASTFMNGHALVKRSSSDYYSYLQKDGSIDGSYAVARQFSNGRAIVEDAKLIYALNEELGIVSSIEKNYIIKVGQYNNGFYLAEDINRNLIYLDDLFGDDIIPESFQSAEDFSDERAIVKLSPNWIGMLSCDGKIMAFSSEYQYRKINNFSEGYAAVQNIDGYWGYINKDGKEIIPCQYVQADDFSDGLAGVLDEEGIIYYIDQKGNKKITFEDCYYSSIELEDKTIILKAKSSQELAKKKLQVLTIIKDEMLQQTVDMIDQLAFDESSQLFRPRTRKRKNNK